MNGLNQHTSIGNQLPNPNLAYQLRQRNRRRGGLFGQRVERLEDGEEAVVLAFELAAQVFGGALEPVAVAAPCTVTAHYGVDCHLVYRGRLGGGEEESQVVIEVRDTGTGIRAEEQDRVFERFYRGSGSLEREGFGLGLAIAKRMVDVMGGEISVSSEEGRGSTFTIRLAAAAPSPTPIA